MYYEINVSRKGKHVFATAPRSLTDKLAALALYEAIKQAFPDHDIKLYEIVTTYRAIK